MVLCLRCGRVLVADGTTSPASRCKCIGRVDAIGYGLPAVTGWPQPKLGTDPNTSWAAVG